MTYLDYYIVPDSINPLNEDKAVQVLRTSLSEIEWLKYCLLMTFRYPDKDGLEFPAYYPKNNGRNHRIITPDNKVDSLAFFSLEDNLEINSVSGQPNKYRLSFICWFNQSRVAPAINEDITNALMNEIISKFKSFGCEDFIKETKLAQIFDYSGLELKKVFQLGNEFKAFKITFSCYQSDCQVPFISYEN